LYTDRYIDPVHWDAQLKKVKKAKGLNSNGINTFLKNEENKVEKEILTLESLDRDYSLSELKSRLTRKKNATSFFKFADEYFQVMEDSGNYNRLIAEKPAINHFKRFRNKEDLEFIDVNVLMLEKFKAYLHSELTVSDRTIFNYLIVIRTIFNRAIKNGIVEKSSYPFGEKGLKVKRPKSQKLGLEVSDIIRLEAYSTENQIHQHALNIFLFSFYFAGIRASDVLQIRWKDLKDGRLFYVMTKNKKPGSIKIPAKAQKIIQIYKPDRVVKSDFVFPDMQSMVGENDETKFKKYLKVQIARINNALKSIGEDLYLPIKLTMDVARHSFATISGGKIPIQKLQELYRHSSITTTIGYMNQFLNKGSDEALDQVLNY
jgi:integrase